MSDFTPGAWADRGTGCVGTTHQLIASVYPMEDERPEEHAANVRLIAAAPDLLEALRGMFAMWRSVCRAQGWEPEHLAEAVRAQAAISKATGEEP